MQNKTVSKITKIDFALLSKLAKSLSISPKNWEKIMTFSSPQKREVELVKFILKSSLPEHEEVTYRIREQKYGGFSITLSGEPFVRLSQYRTNTGIVEGMNRFYEHTTKREEFSSLYEDFVSTFANRTTRSPIGYITYKDNGLYTRMCEGSAYRGFNRRGETDLLYTKVLNLIDFTKKALNMSLKLTEFENMMESDDIIIDDNNNFIDDTNMENLASVPNEFIFSQLATLF